MGTGGALYKLKKEKVNDFVLVNGDTIFDIDIKDLINLKNKIGGIRFNKNNNNIFSKKLSNLSLKKENISYDKKGKFMNGGVYFFNKKIFNYVKNKNQSLENEIIPKLIKRKLKEKYSRIFLDIGSPKILKTSNFLKKHYKDPQHFR